MAVLWLLGFQGGTALACVTFAAQHYHVPENLLYALARQESGGRVNAIHHNSNGSRDIGLMQINSSWLPMLARHGLREQDLWDPCVNTLVAAWLLSENFRRWGYTYRALGAYHSPDPKKQWRYAQQVLRHLTVPPQTDKSPVKSAIANPVQ